MRLDALPVPQWRAGVFKSLSAFISILSGFKPTEDFYQTTPVFLTYGSTLLSLQGTDFMSINPAKPARSFMKFHVNTHDNVSHYCHW